LLCQTTQSTGLSGTVAHYLQKNLIVSLAIPIGVGCLTGSVLGAHVVTDKRSDEMALKLLFSVLLAALGLKSIKQSHKLWKQTKKS
jgi:uncharacterized membrane protein YfcA